MNEENLKTYYNKFNEDKRLDTKHGQIEYLTSIKYIEKYLKKEDKIIDIGAGTGKYSKYFADNGYDVFAVELCKSNLREIEKKGIRCIQGNATNLRNIKDNEYNITILFGPMYHLISMEEKVKALEEAKRITKPGGYIFLSYCMNEYAVITHAFIDNNIKESIDNNLIDSEYKITPKETDLYSFVRLEDINYLKDKCNLKRVKILSQDGPTEYIKKVINKMNDYEFNTYFNYHLSICERPELLGAGRHILDILQK